MLIDVNWSYCTIKKKNVACHSSSARIKPLVTAAAHRLCALKGSQDGEKQETFYFLDILSLRIP